MRDGLRKLATRCDVLSVTIGLAVGLAAFYLAAAIVEGLIAPLIAAFIGDSHFELNSFTISQSEFRYGAVLEDVMTFALLVGLAALLLRWAPRGQNASAGGGAEKPCPKCTLSIPAAAERCPYCTEVLTAS